MSPCKGTISEVIERVNSDKLIGINSLRSLEIVASGQKSEKKCDCGHDLYQNEQKLEVSISKIEALHPEEIYIDEEVNETGDRNRKYLNQNYQHAQDQVQRQRQEWVQLFLELQQRKSLAWCESCQNRKWYYDERNKYSSQRPNFKKILQILSHIFCESEVYDNFCGKKRNVETSKQSPYDSLHCKTGNFSLTSSQFFSWLWLQLVRFCDCQYDGYDEKDECDCGEERLCE